MKKTKRGIFALVMVLVLAFSSMTAFADTTDNASAEVVLPETMNGEWDGGEGDVVYYNRDYYGTLAAALNAVYMSAPTETAKVYCKPGADVGAMTHGHVADSLIIYGNGANVTGGEHDLEVDTYGEFINKNISITVESLNGIAVWGQRNTDYTIDLTFNNCKNMNRVYISGATGTNNITLTDCSFDGSKGSNSTSIYSNAPGNITITDTTFANVAIPINLNNKSTGTQTITVDSCTFTDCATEAVAAASNASTYAAPIRVLGKEGATSNLAVNDTTFTYTDENDPSVNGDILLGDGRYDGQDQTGTVTLATTNTAAEVQVQTAGYYAQNGTVANEDNLATTQIKVTDKATADTTDKFVVSCTHVNVVKTDAVAATCIKDGATASETCSDCGEVLVASKVVKATGHKEVLVGAKEATTTEKGYTGDKVCETCKTVLEKGKEIPVKATETTTSPKTGDVPPVGLYVVAIAAVAAVVGGFRMRKVAR